MNTENTENTERDPFIVSTLARIAALVAEYRAEHDRQTDTESEDFVAWKANVPALTEDETDRLSDWTETIQNVDEYLWETASAAELLQCVSLVDNLTDTLRRAIRSHYNAKGLDRATVEDVDLSAMRARIVKVLDGTLTNIDSGVFDGMTVEDLTAIVPRAERGDGEVWSTEVLPKAPRSQNGTKTTNDGPKTIRGNNTTVKLTRDGKFPADYPASGKFGDALAKYFGGSPDGAVKRFGDRFDQYRNTDSVALYEDENGTVWGLTTKPFSPENTETTD